MSAFSSEHTNIDGCLFCISTPQRSQASPGGATCWALLLLCGAAAQQAGLWSLYSGMALWCGLIGGAMGLVGAVGFECCVPGHSAYWTWNGEVPRLRGAFWHFLLVYIVFGALAILFSADFCPVEAPHVAGRHDWGDRYRRRGLGERGGGCVAAAVCAGVSLLSLLGVLFIVYKELGAMRRGRRRDCSFE